MPSVLIIGGLGFLGLHLIQQFLDSPSGYSVHVFDVRPLPALPLAFLFAASDVAFYEGDITSAADVAAAIAASKCSAVVHAALPMHGLPQEVYEKVNVAGTANALACAKDAKVPVFVYTSSAGVVFNGQDIHNGDERWPIPEVPMDGYNDTKARAEAMVLAAHDPAGGFRTVALRPAGIFGPGDRQLVPGLRAVARLGQSKFQLGDNNNLFDWTYAGNVADAHVLAADKLLAAADVGGRPYFITNDAPTYFWTLARTVWKADGHIAPRTIVLSRPLAIAAGHLLEFFSKLLGKEPGLTPFRAKIACASRYHNIDAAKRELGYSPRVDLEEGIRLTLLWMDEVK